MQIKPEYPKQDVKANRIVLVVLLLIFGLPVLWLLYKAATFTPNTNKTQTTLSQDDVNAELAKRDDIINRFAPMYCANHQGTVLTGSTDLPVNDGRGWTDEECKAIIAALYDLDSRESAIQAVVDKKIGVGMSVVHLGYSWGNPKDINSTVTNSRERQQWVYSGGSYVYVEDGKITSYQN